MLVLEVPEEVAERFEWIDPPKPYREFVLPREVANHFGPRRWLARDGTVRDPEPDVRSDEAPGRSEEGTPLGH